MKERWSRERAWDWYNKQPWPMGINYCASQSIGGELWQEDTMPEIMPSVESEMDLMESIGINTVRMFLPFAIWYHDGEAFLDRLDMMLCKLHSRGITMMPVIYNDCVGFDRPANVEPQKRRGWHQYDIGHHGGHKENPFTGERVRKGWILWDEPEYRPRLEEFIRALIGRFGKDERIIAWDMWNEPGNSNRHDMSIPFLKRAFEVAREMDPVQPLTAGPWQYPEGYGTDSAAELEPIQKLSLELSDIVTFHQYDKFEDVKRVVAKLEGEGRPMMNTEWLNRILDNFIEDNLPLYHDKKIGSYSWGLVAGKAQHFLPWDHLRSIPGLDLTRWQHDLFHEDHTPYDPREIEMMKKYAGK